MAFGLPSGKRVLIAALLSPFFMAACASGPQQAATVEPVAPSEAQPVEPQEAAEDPLNPFESLDSELEALEIAESDTEAKRPRVAILVPQTGRGAKEGQALVNAATMALFDFRNDQVDLVPYDTEGNPDVAAREAQRALEEGADIILGPLLSSSVRAVSDQLTGTNIPVLSFSNNRDVATDQTHVTGFLPGQQVLKLLEHAQSETLYRVAVMVPDNAYGQLIVDEARAYAPDFGVEISKVMRFVPGSADYSDQIRTFAEFDQRKWEHGQQLQALEGRKDAASRAALRYLAERETAGPPNYDAVILAVTDDLSLRTLSSQLAYFDVDQPEVRILGLQLWDSFSNLHLEPALVGSHFIAPAPKGRQDFARRYARIYGKNPLRLSSIGYDSMALIGLIALNAPKDQNSGELVSPVRFDNETLINPEGFLGIEGLFRLKQDGVAERALAVLEVRPDGVAVLKQAPEVFPEASDVLGEVLEEEGVDDGLANDDALLGDPYNALEASTVEQAPQIGF